MYVKQAITLIQNWLVLNGCKLKRSASTTESFYLSYKGVEIRLSDHLSSNTGNNVIYIMVPQNNKNNYGIFINKHFISCNGIKEVKSFFKNFFLMIDIDIRSQISATTLELSVVKQNLISAESKLKKLTDKTTETIDKTIAGLTRKELEDKIARQTQAYNSLMQSYTNQKSELTALKQKQNDENA
jgi:hypothetical protein